MGLRDFLGGGSKGSDSGGSYSDRYSVTERSDGKGSGWKDNATGDHGRSKGETHSDGTHEYHEVHGKSGDSKGDRDKQGWSWKP